MFGRFGQQEIKEVPENDKKHLQFAARQTCFLQKTTPHLFSKCHHMSGHVVIVICSMLLPKDEGGEGYATVFMTARTSPLLAGNMWTVFKGCMTNSLFIFRCDGKHPPWSPKARAVNIPQNLVNKRNDSGDTPASGH
jgi:hypothetical protein